MGDIRIEEGLFGVLAELAQLVEEGADELLGGFDGIRVFLACKHERLELGKRLQGHHHHVHQVGPNQPVRTHSSLFLLIENLTDVVESFDEDLTKF